MRFFLLFLTIWMLASQVQAQTLLHQPCLEGRDEWNNAGVIKPPLLLNWDVNPDTVRLYLNCENHLAAPPQSKRAAIEFIASGATVTRDAKRQLLLIVPTTAVVTLWARRGNSLVFKHTFKAVPPPLPEVKYFISDGLNGCKPVDYSNNPNSRFTLQLRAVPDDFFADLMPDDARYRVAGFRLVLLRDSKSMEGPIIFQGQYVQMDTVKTLIQPGDQLQISAVTVQRMNFRGEIETLPVFQQQPVITVEKAD